MADRDELLATAATFNVGVYDDGSGPVVRVRYDTTNGIPDRIWIDCGDYSEQWVAFPHEYAEDICAAIMSAARAIASEMDHDR